jgi:hypothetical protein
MTRLLICTAMLLALTAAAHAQVLNKCWGHDACVGQNISVSVPNGNRCAHTIAKGNCYETRMQQIKPATKGR